MTRVVINPGICGFTATIEVTKQDKRRVSVSTTSDCEKIARLGKSLRELDGWDALKPRARSEVHRQASKHQLHSACPVPIGVLKAIEAEAGLAASCDVVIHFEAQEPK